MYYCYLLCCLSILLISCGRTDFSNQYSDGRYDCGLTRLQSPDEFLPSNILEFSGQDSKMLKVHVSEKSSRLLTVSDKGCIYVDGLEEDDTLLIPMVKGIAVYEGAESSKLIFQDYAVENETRLDTVKRHFKSGDNIPVQTNLSNTKFCFDEIYSDESQRKCLRRANDQDQVLLENFKPFVDIVPVTEDLQGDYRLFIIASDLFETRYTSSFDLRVNNKVPIVKVDFEIPNRIIRYNEQNFYTLDSSYKLGFQSDVPLVELDVEICVFQFMTPSSEECEWQKFDPFQPLRLDDGWGRLYYRASDLSGVQSPVSYADFLIRRSCLFSDLWKNEFHCTDVEGAVNIGIFYEGVTDNLDQIITIQGSLNLLGVNNREIPEDLFRNLISVSGLQIYGTSLTHLRMFEGLEKIHNSLKIESNFFLESVESLKKVEVLGGDLVITSNLKLNSLTGVDQIRLVGQDFIVKDNELVEQIQFNSLIQAQVLKLGGKGKDYIRFPQLKFLNELHLEELGTVRDFNFGQIKNLETLNIHDTKIEELDFLNDLESIKAYFYIKNNELLKTVKLPKLNYLFFFEVTDNPILEELLQEKQEMGSLTPKTLENNPRLCKAAEPTYWFESQVFTSEGNCTQNSNL